jgi:hypothetical protein
MSALLSVRNLILLHLDKNMDRRLKTAVMNVITEIDMDLDIQGYSTAIEVDEALEHLDKVLVGLEEEQEEVEEDKMLSSSLEFPKKVIPQVASSDES